jgi:hypothetical protein
MSKYARIKWLISAVVLTGFCHASHAQIKLVGLNPHAIPVDKNGAGSAFITLQNQGPAAAPLRLSITDFVHLENGRAMYPLNSLPVLTPSTDADKQKVNNHQLAANETVDFKLAVTQLWDAGESVAELQNSGVKIDNLRAVRIPASYNVQLDASSASVLLAPDSAALVTIVNNDAMDYRFSWELLTRGKISSDPGQPAVTVPANGSARINLSRAAPPVSWVAAGTLKDDVADSTLVLHPAIEAQDGIPPQAPKMLPFKLRLSFWSAVPQEVSEFFWTMLLLLAGALASMAARYFIPNAVGALKLRRQLDQLDGKVAGISDNVSSKWQVLLAYNLETCRAGLHDFPWAFPAFATRLADLQVQADMFSQWVNTAYGVGSALDQVSPLLQNGRMPPTVLDLVEQSCQAALQPIESGMTNADELQGMKTALKTAQDLIAAVRTSVPIPTLDGKIQEREKRLQAAGAMNALIVRFPEFAGLLTQVAANLGAPLSPTAYVDRDMLSQKAEMLMEYNSLEQRSGAGALAAQVGGPPVPLNATLTRLRAGLQRLEIYIAPDSDQSLQKARLFLIEMRQDFYTTPLTQAVNSAQPALEMHVDPSPIETGVPIHFSLRFVRDDLNDIAAIQEWTCHWSFDDGSPEEKGWGTYHRFTSAGNRNVSVSIVDLQGNAVTAQPIGHTYAVTAPAVVRRGWRGWLRRLRLTPEAKVEAAQLLIVLAVALFGVFASARTKIETLGPFSAAATLVGLGFGADTLKNLITQKPSDK